MTVPPVVRRPAASGVASQVAPVFSLTREVSPQLLDADWVTNRERDVFLWDQPSRGLRILGLGASVVHYASGPRRFSSMAAAVASSFADVTRLDGDGPGPRFVGGFGFADSDGEPDGWWGGFPAACMVMPEVCLLESEGRAWAIATTPGADLSTTDAISHLTNLLDRLRPPLRRDADPASVAMALDEGSRGYRHLVAAAASEIAAGSFQKLVVARAVDAATGANPARILDSLRRRYPECVTYAISAGDRLFLGATPEPLVASRGREVHSLALAGTIARGADQATDDDLGARLMADPKEREEHGHVVLGIRRTLAAMGVILEPEESPTLRKLATVQHLETQILGRTASQTSLIELAGALHPTPAVGGLPEEGAVEWIAAHEELDRGWYAGPIGYLAADGDGEFHVALRCALLKGGIARCFVGAGIVAGSDPDRELAETTAKLRAIADSLSG
jgi:isochorismate synthase